jgi:acetolactate synthase-1/2/3 large subunit
MKASDYIARVLARRGVTSVFEMSGGMITHLLDSIYQHGRTRIVTTHHEQAAAFAAEGWARMTGVPGVALATSGPGATNLLTAIGSCYFDSVPAVFITGQVNRHEQKGTRAIRQLGFQETDIVTMAGPVTKAAWSVREPADLPQLFDAAFTLAVEGRPGPVLLDVPMDVQRADVTDPATLEADTPLIVEANRAAGPSPTRTFLGELATALATAQRPLILAGGGLRSARVVESFRRLVEKLRLPVACSLMAIDVLPHQSSERVGLIGSYGNRWANAALGECDCLLVLGSRLDVRQTGADTESFRTNKRIFHVDVMPGEMNNRVTGCTTLISELADFLRVALASSELTAVERPAWRQRLHSMREQWPDTAELRAVAGINPNVFVQQLTLTGTAAGAYCVDVGQHQMWAAQSVRLTAEQRFLTSGGMGAMGFALPAALGAALAQTRPVVVIAGDGGFQTNMHELETVKRGQLPIKLIVLNNQCHGMVRQFQESYFDARYQSTLWGYSAPDFTAVGNAYGIASRTIKQPSEIAGALHWLWQNPHEPQLLQVMIDTFANAYPKMAFGRPITEMEPFAKPLDMEGT